MSDCLDSLNTSDYKTYPKTCQQTPYKSICIGELSSSDFQACEDSYSCCNQHVCKTAKKPCPSYNNPDLCTFRSIITPLSELKPVNTPVNAYGPIEFTMRRKNKVVTIQWEPFTGKLTTSGIAYMSLAQSICNQPLNAISSCYTLSVNGVFRQAQVVVNPKTTSPNILFYLNSDSTATGITANDSVVVNGGCFSWIVA